MVSKRTREEIDHVLDWCAENRDSKPDPDGPGRVEQSDYGRGKVDGIESALLWLLGNDWALAQVVRDWRGS